jgi:hypothetical protein
VYNKLFSKIVTSSVWLAPTDHRIVWITFIAMMDQDGFVPIASVANVAHTARVTPEAAAAAIKAFESPDPHDPEQEFQGRRIERVSNGWLVLNAKKYAMMATGDKIREQNRIRNQAYRARKNKSKMTSQMTQMTSRDANDENVTTSDHNQIRSEEIPLTPLSRDVVLMADRGLDDGRWWPAVRSNYPPGTYKQADWLEGEREARFCVDSGLCTPGDWIKAVNRFLSQHRARGSSSQFIPSPKKFFHREARSWMEPFPLPDVPSPTKVSRAEREKIELDEMAKLKARAALCGFRPPGSVEPAAAYETALRTFERENPPGKGSNGAHFQPKLR